MMYFDRYKNWTERSWAFGVFRKHHTEINKMYWTFVPTWSYCNYMVRHAAPHTTPDALFHASGPDVHRLDPSLREFNENYNDLANWVRLSILFSAVSYLEVYMKKIITLALWSDPSLRLGKPKLIDGLSLIKNNIKDDLEEQIKGCIKGGWPARVGEFQRLFKITPQLFSQEISSLERIRTLRNKMGHSFGRNLKIEYIESEIEPIEKLSESNLRLYLDLIFRVATEIDDLLISNHIGCFESLLHFHSWRNSLKGTYRLDEGRWFSKEIGRLKIGQVPPRTYFIDMASYYHSC